MRKAVSEGRVHKEGPDMTRNTAANKNVEVIIQIRPIIAMSGLFQQSSHIILIPAFGKVLMTPSYWGPPNVTEIINRRLEV